MNAMKLAIYEMEKLKKEEDKKKEILRFCLPNIEEEWAGKISSIVIGCDFGNVKSEIKKELR